MAFILLTLSSWCATRYFMYKSHVSALVRQESSKVTMTQIHAHLQFTVARLESVRFFHVEHEHTDQPHPPAVARETRDLLANH